MTFDLSLTNFRCWESKNISIPSSGICLINGRSGKGKSTILNSILYAVTGKLKNISTINKKSTKVSIKIDNISITRTRGPNRLSVEKEGKIYENDDAQSIINSLFGEEFSNTSYIDQDNVNSFVSLSPSDKMEFLEKLLLSNYDIDGIKEKIRTEISNTKSKYTSEESKQTTIENIIKTMTLISNNDLIIDKIKINKGNFTKIFEKIKSNYEVSEKNIKTIKSKVKKLEEEETHFFKYNEQRKKLTYQIEEIESNPLYQQFNNVNDIKLSLNVLDESKNYYIKNKEYTILKQKEEELTKKYNDIKQSNNKEKEEIEKQLEKTTEISKIKSISKTRISELEKCIDLIDTITILEEELSDPINYQEEIEKEEKKYNSYNETLLKKKQLLSNFEKSYTCPSCNKFLKMQNDKLILSHSVIDTDINLLKSEIEEIKDILKSTDINIQSYKKRQIIYQQKEEKYNSLFDKLDSLRKDIECDKDKILEEIKFMNTNLKQIEDLTKKLQLLNNDKLLEDVKKELSIINIKLSKINNIVSDIKSAYISPISGITNISNDIEYEECIKKISILSEKISNIEKLSNKYTTLNNELSSIKEYNKENKDYSELLRNEREKIDMYSEKINTYKSYIERLNMWERTEKEIEKYNELKISIEECSLNKQKLSDRLRCLVKLRDHVKNAEQKCISDFIDSLNDHASIYIEHFFPDEDIKVELKTTQESKTGKEKISLNFNIIYRQINGDLSYLSGGERDRVNLAFTLAFSEIINNRVLLLDECISSLDAETTSIVLENLKEKYKGKLVILVSHQANLGFFDKVIDI
jgi:DNA repair exonuclease SbcCD ATPase subunit